MRRLYLALVCLVMSVTPLEAALAHVSRVQGGGSVNDTSITSPSQSHASGNLLVVMASFNNGNTPTVSSVTDTAGNTYTLAGTAFTGGANVFVIYYAANVTGHASNVVTIVLSASAIYRAIVVREFSGAATSSVLGSNQQTSGNSTSINSGTLTVTASEEVIVGYGVGDGYPVSGSNGFTLTNFAVTGDANPYFFDEYKIVTASEAATATQTNNAGWYIKAASFKVATGGGGATPCRRGLLGVGCDE